MYYVCACRCGPMQVRQCEATVDLTGRGPGPCSEPMGHRTASNRTVAYHTCHQPVVIRLCLPVPSHRCPTLVAGLADSEEGVTHGPRLGWGSRYGLLCAEYNRAEREGERERSVPCLVIHPYQTAGPEPEQSLADGLWVLGCWLQYMPARQQAVN